MKKEVMRSVSLLLTVLMLFAAVPVPALAESSTGTQLMETEPAKNKVNPEKVNDVISKFTDSFSKFLTNTEDLNKVQAFLTRFGGLTSFSNGIIGILQLSGVIKDPTMEALGEILDTVKDIQTQIKELDAKVDDISSKLDSIAAAQEEKDRSTKARDMQGYWNSFNTDYIEKLDDLMNEYQSMINQGIENWWTQSPHDGVYVLYATDAKNTLTYSKEEYSEGLPAQADNGEQVNPDKSFGIPAGYIPVTSTIRFRIDTYRSDFVKAMSQKFNEAADSHSLDASEAFYADWDAMDTAVKQESAEQYATDILNTLIYHIACETMTKYNTWVTKVTNAYRNYCTNILKQNSGVSAFLNYIYLTHGFEGEAKKEIEEFCDAQIVQAGLYGEFALSCAGQDDLQDKSSRQTIQEMFIDTIDNLSEIKGKALTGHDNYCYVTGTVLQQATVSATASSTPHLHSGHCQTFIGFTSTNWTISVPNIVNNIYSQVLYNQYKALPEEESSDEGSPKKPSTFGAYLHKYGAFNTDNNATLMTRYGGAHEFAFSEGIRMQAENEFRDSNYFKNKEFYNIDVGTGSKVEQKYYLIHDKVLYDAFDMAAGTVSPNQLAGARAYYGESHGAWITDEAWEFNTGNGICIGNGLTGDLYDNYYCNYKYRINFTVLKQTAVHDLNGVDEEDPFLAYDAPSLTEGVSDQIGNIYEDTEKPITALELESESFTYTGEAIKPYVRVRSGKKLVPMDNFTVSYHENVEIGTGTITVRGTGDYSGTITETFNIVPKGTALKKVKKSKKAATVRWKKQSAKMPSDRITGYQIRYSMKKSMKGAKTVTVNGYKKTSAKIRNLQKNKKYYFQIRTYIKTAKDNIYSGWSRKKTA